MKLVVDGDILLFRACAAIEKDVDFGNGLHVLFSRFEDAKGVLEDMVHDLEEQANTDQVIFALSDKANWRRNIYKPYKANRKDTRKPLAYAALQEYAEQHWPTLRFKGVEADDVMGIYADRDGYAIWSLDKDLKQCPGHHLVDDEIVYITKEDGDRWHLLQTIIGDVTDNYPGCPGVGPATAEAFLDEPYKVVKTTKVLKSGPNKGQERTQWEKQSTDDVWEGICSLFEKADQTDHDALTQARVARILRDGEYDFEKERVKLWNPSVNSAG